MQRIHVFQAAQDSKHAGTMTSPQRSRSMIALYTVSSHTRTSSAQPLLSYMLPPLRYSFGYTCRGTKHVRKIA